MMPLRGVLEKPNKTCKNKRKPFFVSFKHELPRIKHELFMNKKLNAVRMPSNARADLSSSLCLACKVTNFPL